MSNEYDHFEMSDEVLDIRAQELLAVIDIPHGEERDKQLTHELACIAFEQYQRWTAKGDTIDARDKKISPTTA